MIAKAVQDEIGSGNSAPLTTRKTWLSTFTEPAPARYRYRAWLSIWLKGATNDIPPDVVVRYLAEMRTDVTQVGTGEAIDRFVDKILPKILSNQPPVDSDRAK
jgi:hypothetical protein